MEEILKKIFLDIEKFKDKGVLERAGRAFRQLHDSPQLFEGEFELFEQILLLKIRLFKLLATQNLTNQITQFSRVKFLSIDPQTKVLR